MISVSLWQLVLYVLGGVAVGAIVAILSLAKGKRGTVEPAAVQVSPPPSRPQPDAVHLAGDPSAALSAAETRLAKVKMFLQGRVSRMQNVSVDETAKCLNVSPRRIRRLLDDGALVSIPQVGGGRLVSAVSVLDLLTRRETPSVREPPRVAVNTSRAPASVLADLPPGPVDSGQAPVASPRQLYWYYVSGHDQPLHSIREALQLMGQNYACSSWNEIPAGIRAKIRRERVTQ